MTMVMSWCCCCTVSPRMLHPGPLLLPLLLQAIDDACMQGGKGYQECSARTDGKTQARSAVAAAAVWGGGEWVGGRHHKAGPCLVTVRPLLTWRCC